MKTIILLTGFIFLLAEAGLSRLDEHDRDIQPSHGSGRRFKRQMASLGTTWSNNLVSYYFQQSDDDKQRTMRAGMNYIANRTCIRFQENAHASQRLRINVAPRAGCSSQVGAPGTRSTYSGEVELAFGNCPVLGSAVHELSHSLGSYHEHNRPDRDNYLKVDMAQVKQTGQSRNMDIIRYGVKMYVPFDYGSCMMYDTQKYGFDIMMPYEKEYQRTMGNRRVSFYDIKKINDYYQCKCSVQLPCDNGGYTNPSDCSKCECPKGFFGKLCNERPKQDSYELAASSGWQRKTISFAFKDTGDNYNYFYSTFAYISAPNNKTIQIKLDTLQNFACQNGCNMNGVEIKTKEDIRIVSPIVCCPDQQIVQDYFVSKNNPTVIEMFSRSEKPSVVGISYRYI